MHEFDMLPNDEIMEMMSKEYLKQENRKEMIKGQGTQTKSNVKLISPTCYGGKCGIDIRQRKVFEHIYQLEQDMIMELRHLHTIAPRNFRERIGDSIRIKKRNSAKILKCYYNTTSDKMNYSPTISHDNDYCRLLRHIIKRQQQLLVLLVGVRKRCVYVNQLIQDELSVGYILNSVAIYCR